MIHPRAIHSLTLLWYSDHASKQAYMLVYELASTAAAGGEDERHTTVPQAGDKIHKMIMAENAAWEQDGQKFDDTWVIAIISL